MVDLDPPGVHTAQYTRAVEPCAVLPQLVADELVDQVVEVCLEVNS